MQRWNVQSVMEAKSRFRMEAPILDLASILDLDPDVLVRLWPAERVLVCAFQCKSQPAVPGTAMVMRACRALRKAQAKP